MTRFCNIIFASFSLMKCIKNISRNFAYSLDLSKLLVVACVLMLLNYFTLFISTLLYDVSPNAGMGDLAAMGGAVDSFLGFSWSTRINGYGGGRFHLSVGLNSFSTKSDMLT